VSLVGTKRQPDRGDPRWHDIPEDRRVDDRCVQSRRLPPAGLAASLTVIAAKHPARPEIAENSGDVMHDRRDTGKEPADFGNDRR